MISCLGWVPLKSSLRSQLTSPAELLNKDKRAALRVGIELLERAHSNTLHRQSCLLIGSQAVPATSNGNGLKVNLLFKEKQNKTKQPTSNTPKSSQRKKNPGQAAISTALLSHAACKASQTPMQAPPTAVSAGQIQFGLSAHGLQRVSNTSEYRQMF